VFFLPKNDVLRNLQSLKKNGVDVLLLFFSQAYDGVVKDTNPSKLGKSTNIKYQTVANGLNYLEDAGILRWQGDDIIYPKAKKMYLPGQGGYFAVHDVFASEKFIKNVTEVPKKLALRLLATGIGSRTHKRATKGLVFKTKTLMAWAGVDRFSRLIACLKSLKEFFVITYYEKLDKFNIKVRPKYLAAIKVNKFHASLSGLFHLLKEKGYYIKNTDVIQDILGLMRRYGKEMVEFALGEAWYAWKWKNVRNLGGYLHSIIIYNIGQKVPAFH
jgi:hypothetical protein